MGSNGTLGGKPRDARAHDASDGGNGCAGTASDGPRANAGSPPCRRSVASRPHWASTSPITYRARNTLSCRGATYTTSSNRWRASFQEIAEFLTGHQAEVADDRVLATVLFTDIVDSTRLAAKIGDRDWHALLDAHDAVVRSQLARFRGREVNTSGDGFLAMFDGPQRAIRCAMAIRDAVQALGIEVRAGLHTGECEIRGDDIGGIAVHIGARVSALAGPNDVLVSSTLRDLVIGSGLEFDDRGAHQLKGVPGEWHLFAVTSHVTPVFGETHAVVTPRWGSSCVSSIATTVSCHARRVVGRVLCGGEGVVVFDVFVGDESWWWGVGVVLVVGAAFGQDRGGALLGAGVAAARHHRGLVASAVGAGRVTGSAPVGAHRAGKIRALPGWVTYFRRSGRSRSPRRRGAVPRATPRTS